MNRSDSTPSPSSASLTPESLRGFEGCEHYSEQQASEIIRSLESLADIFLGLNPIQNIHAIDNQLIVSLNSHSPPKNNAA